MTVNKQAFKLLTVCLLLVSYLAAGASTCLGLVLCTEAGGSVALEASNGQGRCADCQYVGRKSEITANGLSVIAAHMPCVDTPFFKASDSKVHQASPEVPLPPPLIFSIFRIATDLSAAALSAPAAHTSLELPAHYRDPASRRCIVLLV